MSSVLLMLSLCFIIVVQLTPSQSNDDHSEVESCSRPGPEDSNSHLPTAVEQLLAAMSQLQNANSQLVTAVTQLQTSMAQLEAANAQLHRDVTELKTGKKHRAVRGSIKSFCP